MSHEVELERPSKVREHRHPVNFGHGEVQLEKEEQCVCQICTCGSCKSKKFVTIKRGTKETHLKQTQNDEKEAACRRQWEVSPDRVLQITRSYRSNEHQDEASETGTVSERREYSKQGNKSSQAFPNQVTTDTGALDARLEGKVLSDNDVASQLRADHQTLSAHRIDGDHQERSAEAVEQDKRGQATAGPQELKGTEKQEDGAHIFPTRYPPSRYRPKTSLRLEGTQEYVTTNSDYFSAKHVEQAASRATQDTRLKEASSSRGRVLRPKTSLWFEGQSHFSTTASEDFKFREQAETVTRHLRPRRFDDPIYDVQVAETESETKKRRTEAEVTEAEAAESLVTGRAPHPETRTEEQDGSNLSKKVVVEDAARPAMQEYAGVPEDHTDCKKSTKTKKKAAGSRTTKEKKRSGHGASMTEMDECFHRDTIPSYLKDNLRGASGEINLRTTNEMEYHKKKMERVRPVKPKSLSKLFGNSSGRSSADSDLRAVASRKGRRHLREKNYNIIEDAGDRFQAAGLVSGDKETRTQPDIDNVMQKRRFKGRRKPYFPEENLRLEGPTSYKTTNSEAYKNYDTRRTVPASRRPQSHDVFHRYTMTEDEMKRIKNGGKSKTDISLFGRKDSTELIAEIQGLLSPESKSQTGKRGKHGSGTHEGVGDSRSSAKASQGRGIENATADARQTFAEEAGAQKTHQDGEVPASDSHERSGSIDNFRKKKSSMEGRIKQAEESGEHLSSVLEEGTEEHLLKRVDTRSVGTTQKSEVTQQAAITDRSGAQEKGTVAAKQSENQASRAREALGTETETAGRDKIFEKSVPVRPVTSLGVEAGENGRDFTTTTSDAFKDIPGDFFKPRKPYYPKPNITSEGQMTFDTSSQNKYAYKTVVEVPMPVRPVSTLKLSADSSFYLVRNEDKIGYSKDVPSAIDARYSVKKPESTIFLGEDSPDYHTTSQTEYKAWENERRSYAERVEDNYRKTKRDRFKTYTRTKDAAPKFDKHHRPSGIGDALTTTQAAFKPVAVERPQPFRPMSNLKVRNEFCSTDMSTTTRETFKKVAPTARVKPIKREPCIRKLGEDEDPVPKTTTSGEAYREVKIPPKPEPYRPSDNLKVTGEMTFSTTTQELFTSRSHRKNVEIDERTKPVKREAVVKDILFPAPEPLSSPGSRGFGRKDDREEVLRSVENWREVDSFTRLRKPSRGRPRTSQKVGEGEFHHVTSSMATHQDRAAKHWKYTRVAGLSGASTDECPAAYLNTDKSEYIFKEVIGNHRFYLPAVQ
ncbi:unnamed protein product [Ixodes hexagonus]